MIKGVKRKGQEYDGKFDPEMGNFLGSFSSIIQTLSGSPTQFKNSGITTELKSSLSKEFENAKTELIGSLLNAYLKLDKLNLLSEIADEIKSIKRLLLNYPIDEHYNPEECFWISEFLEKMNDFIKGQTQILESTNQSDYPTPYYMIPDKESSTFEKPLNYFEFLFNRNGIENLRNNFIKYYNSDEYPDSTYNLETETFTHNHYNIVTGEWSVTFSDFKSFFYNQLEAEYYVSKKLIDEYVDKQKEKTIVVFFIEKTLEKLNSLLSIITDSEEVLKYKASSKPIDALIKHIHIYHSLFVPLNMIPVYNEEKTKSGLELNHSKKINSFKWKADLDSQEFNYLFDNLKNLGFINLNTELDEFKKAFDGSEIKEPIRIKWTCKAKNGHTNKIALLYLISSLTEAKLIIDDKNNTDCLNTIQNIFCDSNNKKFKHLDVSYSSDLKNIKKTSQKKQLDTIIYELKQLVGSK